MDGARPVKIENPRSLVITLTIACTAAAYAYFVFLPSQKDLARLRQQLRDKQQQILDSERLTSAIFHAERELAIANDFTTHWKESAPSEGQLSEVYRQFATFADESRVQLNGIRPQSSERLKEVSVFRVALDCSGSYPNLFEFIHDVEECVPALWIQQLELQRIETHKDRLQCKLTISIFVENPTAVTDIRGTSG
jgi:hypothetical protein